VGSLKVQLQAATENAELAEVLRLVPTPVPGGPQPVLLDDDATLASAGIGPGTQLSAVRRFRAPATAE
jgi:hypothetical protein